MIAPPIGNSRNGFGGAQSARPSRYYMGFWPCQQADGDADDEQVTDRSGNGAHATLNSLTSAEAWNTAGYLESLALQGHAATIPLAKWTPRFATHSFIVSAWQDITAGGSTLRCFGNGVGGAGNGSGWNMCVTNGGALQVNLCNANGVSFFSATSAAGGYGSITPYASPGLHHWMLGYNLADLSFSIYVDGSPALIGNKTISSAELLVADLNVEYGPAIGGRAPTSSTALIATKTKLVHMLGFKSLGLPSNIADIAKLLYRHPRLMLRDQDLVL